MPVVAVAIAALPAVALLLAFVATLESRLFGSALDDGAVRDRYLAGAGAEVAAREPDLAAGPVPLG